MGAATIKMHSSSVTVFWLGLAGVAVDLNPVPGTLEQGGNTPWIEQQSITGHHVHKYSHTHSYLGAI